MSDFTVRLTAGARKDFKSLPKNIREAFWSDLKYIAGSKNPKLQLGRIKGYPELFKIRRGDFRIILEVLENELILLVIEAGDRKTIYRKYQG